MSPLSMRVMIDGKTVRLEFAGERKRGKSDRLPCKVYIDDLDVGAGMVRAGHAKPYLPKRQPPGFWDGQKHVDPAKEANAQPTRLAIGFSPGQPCAGLLP